MIERIHFRNFRALKAASLPLGRFTLIVGANGSGKTTALQGLRAFTSGERDPRRALFAGADSERGEMALVLEWGEAFSGVRTELRWTWAGGPLKRTDLQHHGKSAAVPNDVSSKIQAHLDRIRIYSLEPGKLAGPAEIGPHHGLAANGENLAAVLDDLLSQAPERYEALVKEVSLWLPEFDRILLPSTEAGKKSIALRTRQGGHAIPGSELSQGTLLALAILTLAYLPDPPTVVCLEEPDRGLHPRLLRLVQDSMYRLSYPENCGESRSPVQVVATTHSPYMLDLYRDHREEIVIAEKKGLEATFTRLSDMPKIDEILEGGDLGEVWYTGILGGVPVPG